MRPAVRPADTESTPLPLRGLRADDRAAGGAVSKGEDRPPRLTSERDQAWTLNELANSYSLSGQPGRAVPLFEAQIAIREKRDHKKNLATSLRNLAYQQLVLGRLAAAEAALQRGIELCREIKDESREAGGHSELGRQLTYKGRFGEAKQELDTALKFFHSQGEQASKCLVWANRALLGLLRGDPQAPCQPPASPAASPRSKALRAISWRRSGCWAGPTRP